MLSLQLKLKSGLQRVFSLSTPTGNLQTVFSLSALKASREQSLAELKATYNLSMIKDKVGNNTVDIISYEQGVLLLNDLNWHPRPVFQSYSAYNQHLLELNAKFFIGSNAPKFVIYKSIVVVLFFIV